MWDVTAWIVFVFSAIAAVTGFSLLVELIQRTKLYQSLNDDQREMLGLLIVFTLSVVVVAFLLISKVDNRR